LQVYKSALGIKAQHRAIYAIDETYALDTVRLTGPFDIKNEALSLEDRLPWERIVEVAPA
jgi:hypothetical protein